MEQGCKITPVLLAGGMGERLRPLTSSASPKPFLRLLSKKSLFQDTILRSLPFGLPVIICHESYLSLVQKQLAEISVKPRAIILEPDHRGTAAAISLAAFYLKNLGETMLVLPTDHYLDDRRAFGQTVLRAQEYAQDHIVALGVVPDRAETGYGYIEYVPQSVDADVYKMRGFVEKPDAKLAKDFMRQGTYLWHSGMFMARPKTYLAALKKFQPDIFKHAERAYYAGDDNGKIYSVASEEFLKIISLSVDCAVMEHLDHAMVTILDAEWGDVGTWPQILRHKVKSMIKRA